MWVLGAQAPISRVAREHEALMARNMMSNHTDMQDKYCGHSNDINPIQSQYNGGGRWPPPQKRWRGLTAAPPLLWSAAPPVSFVLALNRVNVVAVTTILVLHVGVIGHHVPCRYDFMFPRRSGSEGVWGAARPPMFPRPEKYLN